jgi:hypothetical protein
MNAMSESGIGRVTLNLSGEEAIALNLAVEHLTKSTTGDKKRQFESIEEKLNRSLGTDTDTQQ